MNTPYHMVWERPEPRPRRTPALLSRDAIVAAAVRLADAEGLDAVSIRRVAAALDAGPMRLYGYVETKDELLDLMVDTVHAEIAVAPGPDWRATLHAVATATRRTALRHEWLVDLFGGRPHLGPHALAVLEVKAAALARAETVEVWIGLGILNAYVVGAVRREVFELRATRAGVDEQAWQAATGPYLRRMFATGRFPALARLIEADEEPDPAEAFEQGLARVLDGIARR